MRLGIAGAGVVTPLGCDIQEVAKRIAQGERGVRIEKFDILAFTRSDRLRRSPPVSLFAVAAASRALDSMTFSPTPGGDARFAVIAAVAKGATIYSARFHEQFVRGGAKAVVPLLFPETVANAPASHVASVLGLSGPNATLLGDAGVAFNAVAMARDLLAWDQADAVLVVATHEHAPVMAEGYARFRWIFRGAPFSEGAAAIVLTKDDCRQGEILHVDRGFPFVTRREIPGCLSAALAGLPAMPDIHSATGDEALPFPAAERFAIRAALGEAFSAAALWQVVFGLARARRGQTVLATSVGLSEQVSALLARR